MNTLGQQVGIQGFVEPGRAGREACPPGRVSILKQYPQSARLKVGTVLNHVMQFCA
jgi:hypothetical protein